MAEFKPYQVDSSKLNTLPIEEGQFIVTTDDGKIYVDKGTERKELCKNEGFVFYETSVSLNGSEGRQSFTKNDYPELQEILDLHNQGKNIIFTVTNERGFALSRESIIYYIFPASLELETYSRLNMDGYCTYSIDTFTDTYDNVRGAYIGNNNSYTNLRNLKMILWIFPDEDDNSIFTFAYSDTKKLSYGKFLDINIDYEEPYEPTYDGSPATKKYVDDNDLKVTVSETEPENMKSGDIWLILEPEN